MYKNLIGNFEDFLGVPMKNPRSTFRLIYVKLIRYDMLQKSRLEVSQKNSAFRNQKFFRAGKVSWNYGIPINISSKIPEKKAPQEKIVKFFLFDTLKNTFWIVNLA